MSWMGMGRAFRAGVAACAVAVLLLAAAASASAAGGTISGKVTDAEGEPLEGSFVQVQQRGVRFYETVGTDYSDAHGDYSVTVPWGAYRVLFTSPEGQSYSGELWHGGEVLRVEDRDFTGIDQVLQRVGSLSGRITDETGAPLSGLCVRAKRAGAATPLEVRSGSGGNYSFSSISEGDYIVSFGECDGTPDEYLPEFYDDATDELDATPVTIRHAGAVTGIDAELTRARLIQGRLTDERTGGAVTYCRVALHAASGELLRDQISGATGIYSFGQLPPGAYKVEYGPCNGYVNEFYENSATLAGAEPIDLTSDARREGLDVALGRTGTISGQVTGADGSGPLAGVCAEAQSISADPQIVDWELVDDDGRFELEVPLGVNYKVHYSTCQNTEYRQEWWVDAPDYNSAMLVGLQPGESHVVADAQLERNAEPDDPDPDPIPSDPLPEVNPCEAASTALADARDRVTALKARRQAAVARNQRVRIRGKLNRARKTADAARGDVAAACV